MTERTRRYTVVLHFPFDPGGEYGMQPAGTYDVETIEEQLDSVSFIAFRRLVTIISKRPDPGDQVRLSSMVINPLDLERALDHDQQRMMNSSFRAP
jgi:hypothetical protein